MGKQIKVNNKCPICGRLTHNESKHCIFHASAEEKTEKEFKEALKEYIKKIKEEKKDYNFEGFIFLRNVIDFKKEFGVDIFVHANFKETIFEGFTKFEGIIFKGDANFNNSKFNGASFKNTRFEGDLFLTKVTFKSVVTFEQAIFLKNAYFGETIFIDDATFNSASVRSANFAKTIFKKNAYFIKTNFTREALFWYVRFENFAYFNEATFSTIAHFDEASFKTVIFEKAIFKEGAIFSNAIFNEVANFKDTNLTGCVFFNSAIFGGITNFILIGKQSYLDFTYSKFNSGIPVTIKIREGEIDLKNAILENISLDLKLQRDVLVSFERALLGNTKIKRKDIEFNILQERKNKLSEAKEIYLMLKNNFHSTGRYDDESWAFTKEKDMEKLSKNFYSFIDKYKKHNLFKKILKESNLLKRVIIKLKIFSKWLFSKISLKWFSLYVSDLIYQYGENPWRVIRFALFIIFLFAIILNFSGIVNSGRTNLIIEFIKENQSDEYTLKYLGLILGNFLNCLYFSVVTFTTLGYGDFQPAVGLSRFFVSLEAIIGAITMALFVYTFARRTGGR